VDSDFFLRQSKVFLDLIQSYRTGEIGLNRFVQRIDGLRLIVNIHNEWGDAVFRVVVNLEQINAVTIEARRGLTKEETDIINQQLFDLEQLAHRLENQRGCE